MPPELRDLTAKYLSSDTLLALPLAFALPHTIAQEIFEKMGKEKHDYIKNKAKYFPKLHQLLDDYGYHDKDEKKEMLSVDVENRNVAYGLWAWVGRKPEDKSDEHFIFRIPPKAVFQFTKSVQNTAALNQGRDNMRVMLERTGSKPKDESEKELLSGILNEENTNWYDRYNNVDLLMNVPWLHEYVKIDDSLIPTLRLYVRYDCDLDELGSDGEDTVLNEEQDMEQSMPKKPDDSACEKFAEKLGFKWS